jgi:hypothetical protein
MAQPVELQISRLLTAFKTNESVERSVRFEQTGDAALARLADEIHEQRLALALEIRAFLYDNV